LKIHFISDLFDKLNSSNSSLHGPSENIHIPTSKSNSVDEKLTLRKSKISNETFDSFPTVDQSPLKLRMILEILNTLTDR